MAEESVRARLVSTFAHVNTLDQGAKNLFQELKEWKRLNPEYLFDERLKVIYKDKDQELTKANERLKEARGYHLQLTQLQNLGSKSIIAPELRVKRQKTTLTGATNRLKVFIG